MGIDFSATLLMLLESGDKVWKVCWPDHTTLDARHTGEGVEPGLLVNGRRIFKALGPRHISPASLANNMTGIVEIVHIFAH
jgi:hypothetical protein